MTELVFRGNPQLETERLSLRKVTPDDVAAIFAYTSDVQVPQYMSWDAHRTLEDTQKYIAFILGRYERDEAGEWGIVLKATGQLIGAVGIAGCDVKNKRAEVGYVLAREYWGQEIMPEALGRVIDFAFAEMGLNRVESCHYLPNEKSGRVMQKVGMSLEGIVREKLFAKGRYWDVKQYAILRSDWLRSATVKQFYSGGHIPTQLPGFSLRFMGKGDLPSILEMIHFLASILHTHSNPTSSAPTNIWPSNRKHKIYGILSTKARKSSYPNAGLK